MSRRVVNFRISENGYERLAELADDYGVTVTTVLRVLMAVAFEHPAKIQSLLESAKKVTP